VSVVLDGPPPLPNLVEILSPFSGVYEASGAAFGPELTVTGVTAPFSYVENLGCEASSFAGFPAGDIAVIDRGICTFVVKVANAEAAGASGVIIVNNVAGSPITMGTTPDNFTLMIPSVMISMAHGDGFKLTPDVNGIVKKKN
jgi:extracellular elastinolytic metalloproteinase